MPPPSAHQTPLSLVTIAVLLAASGCGDDGATGTGGRGGASASASASLSASASSGETVSSASGIDPMSSGAGGASSSYEAASTVGAGGSGGSGGGLDCGEHPFFCDDGTCLPRSYACDLVLDCEDGSDERPVNTQCLDVPDAWTCDPFLYYGGFDEGPDDSCDCGCGVVDPDCDDETRDSCVICDAVGSCDLAGGSGDCDTIDPDDNATCI